MPKKTTTKKTVRLSCPHCHAEWAEVKIDAKTGVINPKDVKILLGDKKFESGDSLSCSVCGYNYTTWDLFLAMGLGDFKK